MNRVSLWLSVPKTKRIRISARKFFILSETYNTGHQSGWPNEKTEKHQVSALFASEGGWQDFTLKGGEWLILWLSGGIVIVSQAEATA